VATEISAQILYSLNYWDPDAKIEASDDDIFQNTGIQSKKTFKLVIFSLADPLLGRVTLFCGKGFAVHNLGEVCKLSKVFMW
jgi:hypothetical protein